MAKAPKRKVPARVEIDRADLVALKRESAHMRKELTALTEEIRLAIGALDREMRKPPSEDRGRSVARISNRLEFANDRARRFALGKKLR